VNSAPPVILVQCLTCQHRGVISERELVRYRLKPGAPLAQFAKKIALSQMPQRQRDGEPIAI
jgi:hypothetical protein